MNLRHLFLALFDITIFGFISCTGESETTIAFPATCAEAQEQAIEETGSRPDNGTYTLYIGGDENKPWDAYCYDMRRTTPRDFISVVEADNYSQVTTTGNVTETTFRRYRIDPIKLEIDLLDDTFADTNGNVAFVPNDRDHIPVGWAGFGEGMDFGGVTAEAKIKLTDTSFVFAESVLSNNFFCYVNGAGDASTITIASDLTSVTLTSGDAVPSLLRRTVADCTNLGATTFDEATLPLQYVTVE